MSAIRCFTVIFGNVQFKSSLFHSRSSILVPFAHFGAWYYIVDMYMMFKSFTLRKGLSHSHISIQKRLYKFMVKRWSMLLHHVCLLCIGYPLTVVSLHYIGYYIQLPHSTIVCCSTLSCTYYLYYFNCTV